MGAMIRSMNKQAHGAGDKIENGGDSSLSRSSRLGKKYHMTDVITAAVATTTTTMMMTMMTMIMIMRNLTCDISYVQFHM